MSCGNSRGSWWFDDVTVMVIVAIIAIAVVIIVIVNHKKPTDSFRYLGSLFDPKDGGRYGEFDETCYYDAGAHCMLKDGTSGKCVMNGICIESPSADVVKDDEDIPKPYCDYGLPVWASGCSKHCACKGLKNGGGITDSCMKSCLSNFHPYNR
jgi:hypothetical protein